jgi:lysozyme family protein
MGHLFVQETALVAEWQSAGSKRKEKRSQIMADFNVAVNATLNKEGALSNDAFDSGGLTKYGISHASYPDLDIANLSLQDAIDIYHRDYWNSMRLDACGDQVLANELFDMAVNSGVGTSLKEVVCLQTFLKGACEECLNVDGWLGPVTSAAIGRHQVECLQLVEAMRTCYYYQCAVVKPTQWRFMLGWFSRVRDCGVAS